MYNRSPDRYTDSSNEDPYDVISNKDRIYTSANKQSNNNKLMPIIMNYKSSKSGLITKRIGHLNQGHNGV